MLTKLSAFIRRYDLIQPGEKVICAVSGGADSVALLFAMYLLKEKMGIQLAAAHFNHRLRGAESDGDEQFVRNFCNQFDIELFVGSGDVVPGKKGLEAAARDARYGFLQTLPGKIATAHTADDNAETVLLHLVRGTGLKGLGAIAPVRGNLIRPMLTVTRQDVLEFLQEYHLSYRQDSSNDSDQFLRNRLRHHVMPLLRQENPRLGENLSEMALRLRQDEELLSALALRPYPLQIESLKAMHSARRSRVLERFLKENGVKEPEASHIAMAEALVFSEKPSAYARFPGGVTVCRRYGILTAAEPNGTLEPAQLPCPGELIWGDYRIRCTAASDVVNTDSVFTVETKSLITVRGRRTGDEMRLPGGTKSLKKLFIDKKIPADTRSRLPVFSDELGVLAVGGIGVNLDRAAKEAPACQIRIEIIQSLEGK